MLRVCRGTQAGGPRWSRIVPCTPSPVRALPRVEPAEPGLRIDLLGRTHNWLGGVDWSRLACWRSNAAVPVVINLLKSRVLCCRIKSNLHLPLSGRPLYYVCMYVCIVAAREKQQKQKQKQSRAQQSLRASELEALQSTLHTYQQQNRGPPKRVDSGLAVY